MKKEPKKITMRFLAKELNTTPATISRALNNSPQISEEMKGKVKALAKKYNFQPNSIASNLRSGKSQTIGIIVPYINRHFFSNIIHHIENTVSTKGYTVLICQTEESYDKELEYVDTLIKQRVTGIIISMTKQTTQTKHLTKAMKSGIKLIQIDNITEKLHTSYIKTKDYEGAKNTTLHLLKGGYRKIAVFNGELKSKIYQDRRQGFIDAHKDYNITPNEALFFDHTNSREEGMMATEKLIVSDHEFDAIFSSGDHAALGAHLVLKKHNINIPSEIGLAGFSNEYFTEIVSPSITSSDMHTEEIGKLAAQQILAEIDNDDAALMKMSILPDLIIRESSVKK